MTRTAAAIVVLTLAGLVAACGGTENDGGVATSEIGPMHVHGLGANPADRSLFVATHTGLYRIAEGETEASRVGDSYQDTMGFTVVGPDRFLGSGHPNGTDQPPFLGLIESDSAGEEWKSVSLLGKADFHVLEAAGERIYGFGSDFDTRKEQFLVSDDGGEKWQERTVPESLLSLAVDPEDPDRIVASGPASLFESADAGRTWKSLAGEPSLLSWPEAGSRYATDENGRVSVSDGGSEWQPVGSIGETPVAFEAASAEELYAALGDGSILESSDGGQTWQPRSIP